METLPINKFHQSLISSFPLCASAPLREKNQDIEKTLISKSDHYNILIYKPLENDLWYLIPRAFNLTPVKN
jgi:hypothetical protein